MLRAMFRSAFLLPAALSSPDSCSPSSTPHASDTLAEAASEATRKDMVYAYLQAARYEWMFWDAAYHSKVWPINYDGSISP